MRILITLLLIISAFRLNAQITTGQLGGGSGDTINTITTAVPFLLISPDARAGGMGDAGVVTMNDPNSIHWNASKMVFNEKNIGFSLGYSPWLRALVNDVHLSYLSGYKKINKRQAIGASMRYFSLGKITFTDITGATIRDYNPNEFAFDLALSQKFSEKFSGGVVLRYIYSNLSAGVPLQGGIVTKAGKAVSADISATYMEPKIKMGDKTGKYAIGLNISNLGSKITYTSTNKKDFLPMNLRLGGSLTVDLDKYNSLSFILDMNKLLVPTPPRYGLNNTIIAGKDPNRSLISGALGSFTDAPQGANEELKEIIFCGGMEYWYDKLFAFRVGGFFEDPTKGARKYVTFGVGIRYNVFGLDMSYLATGQNNPLKNTIRFTLSFDLASFKSQNSGDGEGSGE